MIISGGGVHYSGAVDTLTAFAERRGIPVVETVAGKATLLHDHPNYAGPIGVTGSAAANSVAEDADVVVAVGSRLQDFTTGSWAVFKHPEVRFVSVNTARWDAHKQMANPGGGRREGLHRGSGRDARRLPGPRSVAAGCAGTHRRVARLPGLVELP